MDVFRIEYIFRFPNGRIEAFDMRMEAETMEFIDKPSGDLPFWARLDFQQCPHCLLAGDDHPYCPVAACLADVVKRFAQVRSYDALELEVITPERRIIHQTTAQRGISSMLGILFPAAGCLHTAFFRPMVRFHLPLSTEQDTIFRAGGMFLLSQYFRQKQGLAAGLNFDGLEKLYNAMNLVNMNIAERLRHVERSESAVNAIVLLDVFTQTLPMVIDSQLEDIRHLFTPYIKE